MNICGQNADNITAAPETRQYVLREGAERKITMGKNKKNKQQSAASDKKTDGTESC